MIKNKFLKKISGFLLLAAISLPVLAEPPGWESDFGPALGDLTGEDDATTDVTLGFNFPFGGVDYTTVFVGTNGCLQLGSLGDNNQINFSYWENFHNFLGDNAPYLCGFNTDLDLNLLGTIHFNEISSRAVFTWNEVGTNQDETALISFQIEINSDGDIVFRYNGILDGEDESPGSHLDEGIVIGITPSDGPSDPGISDFSDDTPFSAGNNTIYERWCFKEPDGCDDDVADDDLPGDANLYFDLDQTSLTFAADGASRYDVSLLGTPDTPEITKNPVPPPPSTETGDIGDLYSCQADGTSPFLALADKTNGDFFSSVAMSLGGIDIYTCHGLAFHPQTGQLYVMFSNEDDYGDIRWLGVVDVSNGDISMLGSLGGTFIQLAFDSDANLYTMCGESETNCGDTGQVYQVLFTGQVPSAVRMTTQLDESCGPCSMAFNPNDGLLYRVPDQDTIETYDPESGDSPGTAITVTDPDSDFDGSALVWDDEAQLFYFTDDNEGNFGTVTEEGNVTLITDVFGNNTAFGGSRSLAVLNDFTPPFVVPTLSLWGLVLLGLGLLVVGWRSRK